MSFGGTASLFFGMSFLSLVEFVFFVIKKQIIRVYNAITKRNTEIILLDDKPEQKPVGRRIEKADILFKNVKPISIEKSALGNTFLISEKQYKNKRITSVGIGTGIPYFN